MVPISCGKLFAAKVYTEDFSMIPSRYIHVYLSHLVYDNIRYSNIYDLYFMLGKNIGKIDTKSNW